MCIITDPYAGLRIGGESGTFLKTWNAKIKRKECSNIFLMILYTFIHGKWSLFV